MNGYNLYADPRDRDAVINEFKANARHLKRSRGNVYMYHEVIAFQKNGFSLEREQEILNELAAYYIQQRAENHLCFTALHSDKAHTHIHLMISANAIDSKARRWLSKTAFADIQKKTERHLAKQYPELETCHYHKQGKKAWIKEQLRGIFEKAETYRQLNDDLKAHGLEIRYRKNTPRALFEGKAYRLKTMGLESEYNKLIDTLKKTETSREKQQEEYTQERKQAKEAYERAR